MGTPTNRNCTISVIDDLGCVVPSVGVEIVRPMKKFDLDPTYESRMMNGLEGSRLQGIVNDLELGRKLLGVFRV